MTPDFNTGLGKNSANYAALTPLDYIARAAEVYGNRLAIAHGSVRQNWRDTYARTRRLANTAKKLAADYGFDIEVLERKQLEALKMGSFLSVTRGSEEAPKFIVLKHMGGKAKDAPVVLVGKGITFDTGGISLKAGPGMDEMKYDMCGAGSVLGTFRAIGEMGLKLNVIGIVAPSISSATPSKTSSAIRPRS